MIGQTLYESGTRRRQLYCEFALSGLNRAHRVCYTCRQTAYASCVVGRKGRLDSKSDMECQAARTEIDPSHARSLEHSKKHRCFSHLASELRLWLSVCLLFLLHVTSLYAVSTASDAGVAASPYTWASSLPSVCSSSKMNRLRL